MSSIICDPGSISVKMGFAGDNFPKQTIASLVGRPVVSCKQSLAENVKLKEIMIGKEALKYRSLLELSYPISEGIVKHWGDMQLLLTYCFDSIGIKNVKGTSVFMTESIMNPIANKEEMLELMFESFQVNRFQCGFKSLMPLHAEGLQTGLLVDSGDGVTYCVPVIFGNIVHQGLKRFQVAGKHVTNYLMKLLQNKNMGYYFNQSFDFQTVNQLKQKYCFISGDIKMENKLAIETCVHEKKYVLPDGKIIKFGKESFLAPEILLNPSLAGIKSDGIGQIVFQSINNCEMGARRQLYSNIIINGGTSMLPGFPTRLKEEVQSFLKRHISEKTINTSFIPSRIIDPPSRQYNQFIGASLVAKCTQNCQYAWISREIYQQQGKRRIAQKMKRSMN